MYKGEILRYFGPPMGIPPATGLMLLTQLQGVEVRPESLSAQKIGQPDHGGGKEADLNEDIDEGAERVSSDNCERILYREGVAREAKI